jgi:3'-phosphoadenosine 5'-phosphosulfate sulfotransferase (PAPS reductase)/FAD synthetase
MPDSIDVSVPGTDPRSAVWETLRAALPRPQLEGATRCAVRLYAELRDREHLERNTVLIAYGGGKDSSYMLAFVRQVQLIIHRIYGHTFRMRVATGTPECRAP